MNNSSTRKLNILSNAELVYTPCALSCKFPRVKF